MKRTLKKSAASLERSWAKWPGPFPSFIQWLDREGIPYLSHSQVAEYCRCNYCYYRRYVLGEKEETQAMLLGTLFHKAAAGFYEAKRVHEPERVFGRIRLSKLDDDRQGHLRNAITLLCQNRHADCEVVSVEEPFFLDLAPGLPPIIGIADLVLRRGKALTVVDHKTSKTFNDHDPAQLVLYAEHLGRLHNTRVTEGIFDEYRLVPNLDRIRKPAFRRTHVRLSKKMLPPLVRTYKAVWEGIQRLQKYTPSLSEDCWICRSSWY
ncbi:MAG: PD-(D/E)XK nuclease family protein [Terrimicrobiaceae bacterium]